MRTSMSQSAQTTTPTYGKASEWMQTLERNTTSAAPFLVRQPSDGKVYLIEGTQRRHVKSALLLAALEREVGTPRPATTQELANWSPSVPVEVMAPPNGAPFVVVGGKRLPVRGLPVLNPVAAEDVSRFPKGKALNVVSANVSRSKYEAAVSGRYQVQRLRSAIARRGVVGVASAATKRGLRVIRRKL